MHHNLFIRKHPYTAVAMAMTIALAGCNGEGGKNTDSGGSPEFVVPATISAQNATFITEYKDNYVVDLSDKVSVNGGHSFTLVDVTALTDTSECQPSQIMAQSFTVSADSAKSCNYEYTVAISEAAAANSIAPASLTGAPTDVAITRVAVTSESPTELTEVELPAISAVTLIEQLVEVDVKEQLLIQTGQAVPDGYTLSTEISLPYSTNTANVDTVTDTITYTPSGGFEGIERILFSYKNDATGEVLLGTLDIAVSQVANEGILVQDDITHDEVAINEQVIIDVTPFVSSIDGDSVQLIYVDSFNAATAPLDAEDVTNTKFTFETSRMGNHYVSFAVSDNNGAYAMGLMEVPAFDPNKTGQWDGIFYQGLYFTGPLTIQEAAGKQVTYNDTLVDNYYNPAVDLALFSAGNALNYCGLQGRLPTSEELNVLSSQNVQTNHNWPISEQYLANDDGTYKTVDLTTGIVSEYLGGNYIVSCIEGGLTVQPAAEETIANGVEEAEIVFTLLGQDEQPIVGPAINFTVQSDSKQASLRTSNQSTDINGQAIARVTNIKAEEVTVCGEVGIQNTCSTAKFIGDPATAKIVSVTSNVIGWTPRGDDTWYPVEAKIEDVNGNPVKNVMVTRDDTFNGGDVPNGVVWIDDTTPTTGEGLQHSHVQNTTETAEFDETHHAFEHVNTSGQLSSIDHKIYWGMWQWDNPLEVKAILADIRCFNSGCTEEVTQECTAELGPDWRSPTSEEFNEYYAAANTPEPPLNLENLHAVDPIVRAIFEFSQDNQYTTHTSHESMDISMPAHLQGFVYSRYSEESSWGSYGHAYRNVKFESTMAPSQGEGTNGDIQARYEPGTITAIKRMTPEDVLFWSRVAGFDGEGTHFVYNQTYRYRFGPGMMFCVKPIN